MRKRLLISFSSLLGFLPIAYCLRIVCNFMDNQHPLFHNRSVTSVHCKVIKVSCSLCPLFQFLRIGPSLKLPYFSTRRGLLMAPIQSENLHRCNNGRGFIVSSISVFT